MKLNVGCGGRTYEFYDLKCEVNCDVQRPKTGIPGFVVCDIGHLPFKANTFEMVYAFNVLEHVKDYKKAMTELNRVSSDKVTTRQDRIFNLANWFTSDHVEISIGRSLVRPPICVRLIMRMIRFPIDHSLACRNFVHFTFPVLRRLGLLDTWNFYEIK